MTNLPFNVRKGIVRLLITGLLPAAMLLLGYAPTAAQVNLVANGSFEQPAVIDVSTRSVGDMFDSWTVTKGDIDIVSSRWQAANGKQAIDLNGNQTGGIAQAISTTPGQSYRLRFAMAGNPDGPPSVKTMRVQWGAKDLGLFNFDVTGRTTSNLGWQHQEVVVVALEARTLLSFTSTIPGNAGPALDDVSVEATGAAVMPSPSPTASPAPSGVVCPPTAPVFPETGFCIDNPAIQAYFQARGGVETFGFPASRTFRLLGFPAQVFQRHVLRVHPDGVRPLNLLDPDVLPVTTVNFATFPPHDPGLASSAPPPSTPNYGQAVLAHLQANVPDSFQGVNVRFLQSYLAAGQQAARAGDFPALVALEIWGFPTSRPARDPNNANFIYQRFQRGILHSFPDPNNPAVRVTRGILLADNLKFVMTNDPALLPIDLRAQVQGNRFFNQYCPNNPASLCRPAQLPDTDLTAAFQTERQ